MQHQVTRYYYNHSIHKYFSINECHMSQGGVEVQLVQLVSVLFTAQMFLL